MASQSEARRRLAALIDQRRLDLRLTWQDVAERGGVSLRALANARTGDSEIRQLTQAGIEAGLQWEPGSVARVLEGGDAVEVTSQHAAAPLRARPSGDPQFPPEMEEGILLLLPAIEIAIETARRRFPDQPLTGSMIFPDHPADADSWDRLAARGHPPELVARWLAGVQWREAELAAGKDNANAAGLIAALDRD